MTGAVTYALSIDQECDVRKIVKYSVRCTLMSTNQNMRDLLKSVRMFLYNLTLNKVHKEIENPSIMDKTIHEEEHEDMTNSAFWLAMVIAVAVFLAYRILTKPSLVGETDYSKLRNTIHRDTLVVVDKNDKA